MKDRPQDPPTGNPIAGAGPYGAPTELISFSIGKIEYEIELSVADVAKFDQALEPFIRAAEEVTHPSPLRGPRTIFRCVNG